MQLAEPERTCVGCRQVKPKRELVRVVATETGAEADLSGRRPGRGIMDQQITRDPNVGDRNILDFRRPKRHAPRHAMAVLSSDQEAAVRTQFATGAQPAEAKPTGNEGKVQLPPTLSVKELAE